MQQELFSEPPAVPKSPEQILFNLLTKVKGVRDLQKGYYAAEPGEEKQRLLRAAKLFEKRLDDLIDEYTPLVFIK